MKEIYQPGDGKVVWGKKMCGPCVDGKHSCCDMGDCDCLHHQAQPRKPRVKRDASLQETMEKFGTIQI